VADDAVRVVIQIRARRRDAVDEAALDERDEARLVEAGRRHRSAEREKDGAVSFDAPPHQFVRSAFLTSDIRRKPFHQNIVGSLSA
jgi:hypothetical protein